MTYKLPANNLAEQVMARLSADIRRRLAPGARLPTEQELTTSWVSAAPWCARRWPRCAPTGWS